MQRIFRNMDHASALINSAQERQPYRNAGEIRNLFKRLAIPMKKFEATGSCHIVQNLTEKQCDDRPSHL